MMFMCLKPEEKEKEKKGLESLMGCSHTSRLVAPAVERLERKMTATPPPRLPLRGKYLMEKRKGVKYAITCSSPVSVNQVSVRNKTSKCSSSISSCS